MRGPGPGPGCRIGQLLTADRRLPSHLIGPLPVERGAERLVLPELPQAVRWAALGRAGRGRAGQGGAGQRVGTTGT